MRFMSCGLLLWLTLCAKSFSALAAPVLFVNDEGILTGAKNVQVGNDLYSVAFASGACVSVFSGCLPFSDDFIFRSRSAATTASQALLDQVFVDGPDGRFDNFPGRIIGCPFEWCSVITPISAQWIQDAEPWLCVNFGAAHRHGSWELAESSSGSCFNGYGDISASQTAVWAKWSGPKTPLPDSEPVSEPDVLYCVLLTLILSVAVGRIFRADHLRPVLSKE